VGVGVGFCGGGGGGGERSALQPWFVDYKMS